MDVCQVCQTVLFRRYSKTPLPVALITIVPFVTAQVGCVIPRELITGGEGTELIVTVAPFVEQLGVLCNLTRGV